MEVNFEYTNKKADQKEFIEFMVKKFREWRQENEKNKTEQLELVSNC